MGQIIANRGIIYHENYPLNTDEKKPIIDFDKQKQTIYSNEYKLYRKGNIAEIVQMELEAGVSEMTNYPVYKKDYLNKISEPPKIDVNVEIDRGAATAMEKHYKLTECNTLEDMELYGNNSFNL